MVRERDYQPRRGPGDRGAAGYSFYVLVDGTAVVTLDGEEVATYSPGDFFGEMAILGEGRRYAHRHHD